MENWGLLLFDEDRFLVNQVGSLCRHTASTPCLAAQMNISSLCCCALG